MFFYKNYHNFVHIHLHLAHISWIIKHLPYFSYSRRSNGNASSNIMNYTKEHKVKFIPFKISISHISVLHMFLKVSKKPFNCIADFLFPTIYFLLLFGEPGSTLSALVHNAIINTLFTHISLYVVIGICLVYKYGSFIPTNKIIQFPRVMDIGRCK